ncbi:MAG: hypothetical protein Q8P62_03155 [Candidatus Peregrinibacteria bacterium]|nr:hypothetical protein [Candidatus Peregrinibacteria bacterium]
MRALRNNDTVVAENTPEQTSGRGILSTIGERLGRIPAVSNAIKTGAMLGILGGGAVATEGCMPEREYPQAGSEVSPQYEMTAFALTADEMKLLSTPQAVAGTKVGDAFPEFGEIDGKKVMFITNKNAQGVISAYFKAGNTLNELMTQGAFSLLKSLDGINMASRITIYKNKAYIRSTKGDIFEADIKFNAQNELEVSNFKEPNDMAASDIKVIEIDGVPYLYGGTWGFNSRKNLITGVVEDIPGPMNYNDGLPAYHNGMWIGNRFVKAGGQDVQKAYWSPTFEGVAKSSTAVSKLNVGIQANTGDFAIAEDNERVVVVMSKWNTGFPTSIKYSEFLKPQKPDPEPDPVDAGSDVPPPEDVPVPPVDAGAEVADDVPVPPVDTGVDVPPPEDVPVPVDAEDAAEVAEDVPVPPVDAGADIPPADDVPVPPVDAGADIPPADDVPVPPVDAGADIPPAEDVPVPPVDAGADIPPPEDVPVPEDAPAPADTTDTPDAGVEVADDAAAEVAGDTSTPDGIAETLDMSQDPDAIIAEVKAEIQDDTSQQDGTADAPPDMSQEVKQDITQTPDNQTQPDTSKPPETSTGADTSGQPDNAQTPDSGLPSADSMQADSLQQIDANQPGDVISKPPKVDDGCSSNPSQRHSPKGTGALTLLFATMVATVLRKRKETNPTD